MSVNFVTVLAAAVAGWLVGAVWYGVLGKQWMAALGWTADSMKGPDGKRRMPIGPMVLSFFALLLMAYLLSGIIFHVGAPSLRIGVISGALVWLGFTIPAITVNNAFQKQKPMLTLIDGGHWLLVLVVQGAVIGLLG
ncbi:MAG: hypothetical protein RJB62_242 [Pseudomonadota bacterium]|jgi:hypothetical protein